MQYYYTDREYKELLSNMRIICTTNEQRNEHIKAYFDKKGIRYIDRALKTGDYCFRIDACPALGFSMDTYFTNELFIERKNSIDELATSITNEAFHYELKRAQDIEHKYLLVEQAGGWGDLLKNNYRSQYNVKAFWGTLHTLEVKYNLMEIKY